MAMSPFVCRVASEEKLVSFLHCPQSGFQAQSAGFGSENAVWRRKNVPSGGICFSKTCKKAGFLTGMRGYYYFIKSL